MKEVIETNIQELYNLATGRIGSEMNPGSKPDVKSTWWNLTDKLKNRNVSRKGLWESFKLKAQDSDSSYKVDSNGLTAVLGTKKPYAETQEFGQRISSKGKMHKFFWAKYKESQGNKFYKIMALSVLKHGFITIKARPYFKPAMKEFEKDFKVWTENVVNLFTIRLNAEK